MKFKAILFDLGDTIIEQKHDFYVPLDQLELVLVPGVANVVEELKKLYKLGIVSNTTQTSARQVIRVLERLGVRNSFHTVVTSVDAGCKKPCERIFKTSLDLLGASATERLMIGNNVEEDIVGAKNVGMRTGLFDRRHQFSGDTSADFRFSTMSELPAIIVELEGRAS